MSELTDFRKAKDVFFKTDSQSPLSREQRQTFAGLRYFPENPGLNFELALEKTAPPEHVVDGHLHRRAAGVLACRSDPL